MGQLSLQRAFLEQVLKSRERPQLAEQSVSAVGPGGGGGAAAGPGAAVPRELAAGLPLEAAQALILLGPETDGAPWRGLPAEQACLAAALRLFSRLLPGQKPPLDEDACSRFCAERHAAVAAESSSAAAAAEALEASADAWGFDLARRPSATESLKAMVRNRPTVCCVILEAYVGVVEDPESGEELEHEVGAHCVMVVGGDLLGSTHVAFDPYGLRGGEVAFWSAHGLQRSAPAAWVELSPRL